MMLKNFSRKFDSNIWLVLALSVFAWGPLLTPVYFFNAHDAKHSVFFLVEFDQTFRDGYLWPRWSPDFAFGYGYPLFNLYAPLSFYAAQLLHLTGLGLTNAIKTIYILATIAAGLGVYGFIRRLYGSIAGVVAAVVYMYAPFHLVEIFVRSAYAEFVSLAIIPFLFWSFSELIAVPSRRRVGLAGLIYGLLALTHHTSFFTFSPFLMIYILYLIGAKARLNFKLWFNHAVYAFGAGVLGLMLAAVYLIPVIMETRYIKLEQWTSGSYNYLQHFVYFSQFFSETWGYGYSGPGLLDDFSYQLGIVVFSLSCFALVSILTSSFSHRGTALFFLIAMIMVILLMSPLAEPIWQVLPIASLVQFPWRLLAMTAFTSSVVTGALIASLQEGKVALKQVDADKDHIISGDSDFSDVAGQPTSRNLNPKFKSIHQMPLIILLALIIIQASFSYTLPQYTEIPAWAEEPLAVINWDRASIVDRVGMVSVTAEQPQTSPMEQQYLNGDPLITAGIIAGGGTVDMLHHGGASDIVIVRAAEPVTLQFYTYDYPGWQARLDDQLIPHRSEPPYGLITVDVPPGEHIVQLKMDSTPPRIVGAILSSLALLSIVGLIIVTGRK